MTTRIAHQDGQWTLTGRRPTIYKGNPDSEGAFCPCCGSQIYFRSKLHPHETHFYAALLAKPEMVVPTVQFDEDEKLSWIDGALALPGKAANAGVS